MVTWRTFVPEFIICILSLFEEYWNRVHRTEVTHWSWKHLRDYVSTYWYFIGLCFLCQWIPRRECSRSFTVIKHGYVFLENCLLWWCLFFFFFKLLYNIHVLEMEQFESFIRTDYWTIIKVSLWLIKLFLASYFW